MDTDAGDDAEGRRRKGAAKEETGDTGDKVRGGRVGCVT